MNNGIVDGLNYWKDYVIKNYPSTAYDHHEIPQWADKFPSATISQLLFELLDVVFQRDYVEDAFPENRLLYHLVNTLLLQHCLRSEKNFKDGIAKLEKCISKMAKLSPKAYQLNYLIQDINVEFENRQSSTMTFANAIAKTKQLIG